MRDFLFLNVDVRGERREISLSDVDFGSNEFVEALQGVPRKEACKIELTVLNVLEIVGMAFRYLVSLII